MVTVPRLSAGVITADLTRLGAELEILRGTTAWAHVDVMDGAFCPQLTVGPAFVAAVASTGLPASALSMEVTESVIVTEGSVGHEVLEDLQRVGVRLDTLTEGGGGVPQLLA